MARVHRYNGQELTVTFEGGRCIHAAECVRGLPSVFDTRRTPWVEPDLAGSAEVEAVVARCPTGALKAFRGEARVEVPDDQATASVRPDGPLFLRGRLRLLDGTGGTVAEDFRMALCRCGASAAKPFCDNRHRALPFSDPGEVAAPGDPGMLPAGEAVRITPQADGPLRVEGPLLIKDASGQVRYAAAETWLCRCGASATKPFCDGSHRACGFTAP